MTRFLHLFFTGKKLQLETVSMDQIKKRIPLNEECTGLDPRWTESMLKRNSLGDESISVQSALFQTDIFGGYMATVTKIR